MIKLVIDTATSLQFVGLYEDQHEIASIYYSGNNDHSATCMKNIERILDHNDKTIDDIGELIVGIGPGSYTGVRVAVVIAKIFASTKNIPLYKISTLDLMLTANYSEYKASLIDARRGNVFGKLIHKDKVLIEEGLYKEEEFLHKIDIITSNAAIIEVIDYKVNIALVDRYKVLVDEVHSLEPNYLRLTEAERNLKK